MKCRPALLLCGAILIAVVPAFAERIPYTASATDTQTFKTSANLAGKYDFAAPAPASQVQITGNAIVSVAVDNSGADPFLAATTVLPTSSGIQLASLVGHPDFGTATSDLSGRVGLWEETGGDKHAILAPAGHFDRHPQHHDSQQVPEPGSLPLVLIGLVAISFLAMRRAPLVKNV
jgi:hypothetical protein